MRMKLTAAIKYYLNDFKRAVAVFYSILIFIFVALLITFTYFEVDNVSISGPEGSSLIFLFVVGLNSFKNPFRLFLQTGRSRRTLFVGYVVSLAILSVVMVLLDAGMDWLYSSSLRNESLFISSFQARYGTNGAAFLDSLLWSFISYMALGMSGYFLTTLFYRMNKALKLVVSIGVPIFFLTVLPIIDTIYFSGVIYSFFFKVLAMAMATPYNSMLFFAAVYLLTGGFGFLLTRSATAKE